MVYIHAGKTLKHTKKPGLEVHVVHTFNPITGVQGRGFTPVVYTFNSITGVQGRGFTTLVHISNFIAGVQGRGLTPVE